MNLRRLFPRLFDRAAALLVRRARRTPYVHLYHCDAERNPTRPYLLRYMLFRIGGCGREYPWLSARIHVFCSSDDDRAFHDHPWPFISIILRGQYDEIQPSNRVGRRLRKIGDEFRWVRTLTRRAGDIAYRRASTWHMVTIEPGTKTITLVITLPQVQPWGFLVRHGTRRRKVPWQEFERQHGGGVVGVKP
jgi:hypothetical protein